MSAKTKGKKIIEAARNADSVETMDITREFMAMGVPFLTVGPLFMAAHEDLDIQLKWDRASNRGWVTAAEAAAIRERMAANV